MRWRFSRKVLIGSLAVALLIPLAGAFWLFAQFDLPFLHAGDRAVGRAIVALWWLACTTLIFGWSFEGKQ